MRTHVDPDRAVDREYLLGVLRDLVRINSINPAFSDGTTNEAEIAGAVAREMERLGLDVGKREPEPGRVSVVGRLPGSGGGASLLLYAHIDTVGVEGMAEPFSAAVEGGRVYGRGAYDMKAGLAACLAATRALRDADVTLAGDLLIVAVSDEEAASIGMADVLTAFTADAAIVTEPTELEICLSHRGFCWIEVATLGRAAHGRRFEEGIDANMRMGRFLGRLEELERKLRASPPHPLVGAPSLHAATLRGGTGASTYAARCRLEIERRTIPGETEAEVMEEIRSSVRRLGEEDPTFRAEVWPLLAREPFEAPPGSPIARVVREAASAVLGHAPRIAGRPYWMDTALLAAAGIDTVVIGHGGGGAHAAEEWVDLESAVRLAGILAGAAIAYCGR
jgi:acetylornithine deacetylase